MNAALCCGIISIITMEKAMRPVVNDLITMKPELAKEWNYERNGELKPQDVAYMSNMKVWWKCSRCGYEWESTINNRSKGNGCPVCANRTIVTGINDLATTAPLLLEDWDFDNNDEISPYKISAGSSKKASWKCHICGYKWNATIASRNSGYGCPQCGREKQTESFNKNRIANKGSLSSNYPELASEWDNEANYPLTANDVLSGSSKKVWWICSRCGHKWQAIIKSRVNGNDCPLCANKIVVAGVNDLETRRPDLAIEWCYEKNTITPSEVTVSSGKKVWWRCSVCGAVWESSISHRSAGTGCPICNTKYQTSYPEQAIFFYIKKYYNDAINKFTELFDAQKKFGMEFDIYIPSITTAIEYDGIAWHASVESEAREIKKYRFCREKGIRLIRIKEMDGAVPTTSPLVADQYYYCSRHPSNNELSDIIKQVSIYLGANIDADCQRDSLAIKEQYYAYAKKTSVASLHPELLNEWNYKRNGAISPEMMPAGSSQPIWWICARGHEWKVSPANRCSFNSKCPFCSNKRVLAGFNDLATTHPVLLKEWDYENNVDITPQEIMAGNCKRKVWWVCKQGHRWQTTVHQRVKGSGCPVCRKQ